MRKVQKRQIEETIRQMEEAHDEMRRYIEKGIATQAQELLADCQNAAVAIGTLIENTEGEGHSAVTFLEEYCELVYQIHESLSSGSSINSIHTVNANKIYKSLRKKLIKAENSIRNDIRIRTMAVFLPYKASMWDSLESVWKAADADPDCDAYVIPIPYFDKNPDGSFREEHYEGDQYPAYVPITKYDEFDFGKHMPDAIYIHNGYDDYNIVTSVHPFFYSKNLKKFTDCLTYIPYFVLAEPDPKNAAVVENISHFCTIPGVFNADKIIVQSEAMKKVYIKVLMNTTNDHSDAARKYWNKKIEGTGSPKFDKVMNTKKEDLEIPQEWLKVIEKPDGSWKKIVFYNTSISALLQHSEKMLKKMDSVFETFKEYKDEVALLWRPHPLIKATVKSMRPQLWTEYDRLVRTYREEGWGIYDDSSDIDRAVVLSDAYYGDSSSVVQLYKKIKKPIMMQNVQIISASDRVSRIVELTIESLAGGEHEIYAVGRELNVMFRLDLRTNEVETITDMPEEEKLVGRLYNGVCVDKDVLALVPYHARKFWYYRLKEKKWYGIDISAYVDPEQAGKFVGGYIFNEIVYLFGYHYKNILIINLKSGQLRELFEEKDLHLFWMQTPVVHNNKLFVVDLLRSEMICIDLKQIGNYEIFRIENIESSARNGNGGLTFDGEYFYIVKHHGNLLYKWKPYEKAYPIEIDSIYDTDESFFNGIEAHDRFLFLYSPKGKSYVYGLDGKRSYMMEDKTFYARRLPMLGLTVAGKGAVTVFDNKMKEINRFTTALAPNEHRDYLAHAKMTEKAMTENTVIGLQDFIYLNALKTTEE